MISPYPAQRSSGAGGIAWKMAKSARSPCYSRTVLIDPRPLLEKKAAAGQKS
jgi:hypothetical protein